MSTAPFSVGFKTADTAQDHIIMSGAYAPSEEIGSAGNTWQHVIDGLTPDQAYQIHFAARSKWSSIGEFRAEVAKIIAGEAEYGVPPSNGATHRGSFMRTSSNRDSCNK